jgi:hypothetical protein
MTDNGRGLIESGTDYAALNSPTCVQQSPLPPRKRGNLEIAEWHHAARDLRAGESVTA